MSKLPRQVQAQADAAKAYDESIAPTPADPPKEGAPVDPPAAVDPPATPPAAPVTPPPDPQWEHKFRTLQGIFNAQVPKLQETVKALETKLEEATKAKEAAPAPGETLVTDKDATDFGPDMIDLARRIAREEFGKERKSYESKITALTQALEATKGQVGKVTEATNESKFNTFIDRLTIRLPSWEQVQSTEDCQAWLSTKVPGAPYDWDAALQNAASRHDVEAVLEVFGEFFKQHPAHNPVKQQPVVDKQEELARQVSPSKPRGNPPAPTPQAKRSYTPQEYANKSTEQLRLTKAGKHKEADAIEQELNAALLEGRITS